MAEANNKRFFYGWIIAGALFLITFLPMVFINSFISYYQVPVVNEFGVTDAQFNIANTLSSLGGMLFSLLLATKITKGNTRVWMLIGGILSAICYAILSFTTAIWQVWILTFFGVFFLSAITYVPINFLISQWFIDKKGLITSIIFAGTGLGGVCFSTLESSIIAGMGWRNSFRITALIVAVITVIAVLLIRKSPSDVGCAPYTSKKNAEAAQTASAQGGVAAIGLSKAEALRTASFWLYAISMLCIGAVSAGIITQIPANLIYKGYENEYATVFMVVSLAMIIGKFLLGPIIDKFGIIKGMIFGTICGVVGLVLFIFVPQVPEGSDYNVWVLLIPAFAAAILIPIGTSLAAIAPPLITSSLFGYKDFGGIYGIGNMVFMGGCMIGPLLSSGIYSALSSYAVAWIVFIVIFVVFALTAVFASAVKPSFQADDGGASQVGAQTAQAGIEDGAEEARQIAGNAAQSAEQTAEEAAKSAQSDLEKAAQAAADEVSRVD